jgi:prevent-host-death family protein
MDVPVRDLKNRLSEYLRRVQAGEDIVVTSHGRPVARLSAVTESLAEEDAETVAIARLRTQPWIRTGKGGKRLGLDPPIEIKPGEKTLAEIVDEQRG